MTSTTPPTSSPVRKPSNPTDPQRTLPRGLLVSVRSVEEARTVLDAGPVAVIDVKEPDRGPLGASDPEVWVAVRQAVPKAIPVSLALGELAEMDDYEVVRAKIAAYVERTGASPFLKVGLAGSADDPDWPERWRRLREPCSGSRKSLSIETRWVAAIYADWHATDAPEPERIVEASQTAPRCAGLLVDTGLKDQISPLDESWGTWLSRVRCETGMFVAVAGGLDRDRIEHLAHRLTPDLWAVRGAACRNGDRRAPICRERVESLRRCVIKIQTQ